MIMRKFTARGAAPPVVVEMGHPVGTACLCRRAFRGQGGSKPADSETGGGGNHAGGPPLEQREGRRAEGAPQAAWRRALPRLGRAAPRVVGVGRLAGRTAEIQVLYTALRLYTLPDLGSSWQTVRYCTSWSTKGGTSHGAQEGGIKLYLVPSEGPQRTRS